MDEVYLRVQKFNRARGWERFHDPRSLILALLSELGELAHLFRWRGGRRLGRSASKRAAVQGEIADLFIFMFALCDALEIDPVVAIQEKLGENERRFPRPVPVLTNDD
jgi:dCTP diphosphatase